MAANVGDDDIAYAERILLPPGETFDDERRLFIRSMGTLDLQAVPGSGKTTALLAKLLILDRFLPLRGGTGILVISHTNAAIDEIRSKIGPHCAGLFRYPNFVGTIQAFVDEFLAVPCYANWYGRAPTRIDDDIYDQKFASPPFNIKGFTSREAKNARWFLQANKKRIRWSMVDGNARLTDGYGGKEIDFKKPKGNTKPENYSDWSDEEKGRVRDWVREFKLTILASGCLCYDDAYFLARRTLSRNTSIKQLLQSRFAHVFVDEMQDMERHQHELLDEIFFDGGASTTAFQRIGDRNQAIYDGRSASANDFWVDRATVLELNGSYRLSPVVASVVSTFAVTPVRIDGRRRNPNGSPVSVKPRLLAYSDATKELVIPRFAALIRELVDQGAIPDGAKNRYAAVAWATKPDAGKIRLPDYHPSYARSEVQRREDHPDLANHLTTLKAGERSFAPTETAVSNALLRILRLEGVKGPASPRRGGGDGPDVSPYYTKRTLHEFLRTAKPDYWAEYQAKMYGWCFGVAQGNIAAVLADIRSYVPIFLAAFGRQIIGSAGFVSAEALELPERAAHSREGEKNVVVNGGIVVKVATVHSVKGETHTATLYLESFYERGGGGSYESERLGNQINGEPLGGDVHDLVRQSAKMVYVGFSRPTHLLCFAVHEKRFGKLEAGIDGSVWDVVRV